MKKAIVFAMLFVFNGHSVASEIPKWSVAEKVIRECHSGIDATISVIAGLTSEKTLSAGDRDVERSTGSLDAAYNSLIEHYESDTDYDNNDESGSASKRVDTLSARASRDLRVGGESFSESESADSIKNNAYIGIRIAIPLYSRKERLAHESDMNRQLIDMANLYANNSEYKSFAVSLDIQAKMMESSVLEGGQDVAASYYDILAKREKYFALAKREKRKILAILETCGYVERHRVDRKR